MMYPEKCVICHRILESKRPGMCSVCRSKLQPLTEPRCKRCSKPLADNDIEGELCDNCRDRIFSVRQGFALYPYNEQMQRAVKNFKYRGELAGGTFFADEMAETYGAWIRKILPEVIIPVPIHKKRKRFRGFNQAACLAEQIGKRLGIPVEADYLIRRENTTPQKELDSRARLYNLQKGFEVQNMSGKRYRRILLVDDIYTTGATLEACGMTLRRAGTEEIYFLCLCIGRGD